MSMEAFIDTKIMAGYPKQTMIFLHEGGRRSFRCPGPAPRRGRGCGCNVFTATAPGRYTCNGCGTKWVEGDA